MRGLSLAQVNQFVLRKQCLTVSSAVDDVVQIAHDIAGQHATGSMEPKSTDSLLKKIERKAVGMAHFIAGEGVEIRHVSGMKSLAHRTAGGFMSPLKEQGD